MPEYTAERFSFSDAKIAKLRVPNAERVIGAYDTTTPPLAVRVSPTGQKTFVGRVRVKGKTTQPRITFGDWIPEDDRREGATHGMTFREAQDAMREALKLAAQGINPTERKHEQQTERQTAEADTVSAVADKWIPAAARRKKWADRTKDENTRIFDVYIKPEIGETPLLDLSERQVSRMLNKVADERGLVMGCRVHSAMRAMLRWAKNNGYMPGKAVPITPDMRPLAKEEPRERYLFHDEIRRLWKALDGKPYPFGPLVKLMLVTAARKEEIAFMRWSQIKDASWVIPDTKGGRPHRVTLSPLALSILATVPRIDKRDLVFTTTGKTPASGFSRAKREIDAASKVTDWHLHDLRATVATYMQGIEDEDGDPDKMEGLGLPIETIKAVLNHSIKAHAGVTSVYLRGAPARARHEAFLAWSEYLAGIIGWQTPTGEQDNVIRLRTAAE